MEAPPVEEGLALLNLFDEYGIHWDAFHGRKQSLVELVEKVRGMESLATRLKNRPRALQCMAAQAASQLNYSALPKRMQLLVDIHKPQLPPSTTVAEKYWSVQLQRKSGSCLFIVVSLIRDVWQRRLLVRRLRLRPPCLRLL